MAVLLVPPKVVVCERKTVLVPTVPPRPTVRGPLRVFTDISSVNAFAPANVCALVVIIPGFVESAGAKLNAPLDTVAAFAKLVEATVVIVRLAVPVGPVTPCVPVGPVVPVEPVGPVKPCVPVGPVVPNVFHLVPSEYFIALSVVS